VTALRWEAFTNSDARSLDAPAWCVKNYEKGGSKPTRATNRERIDVDEIFPPEKRINLQLYGARGV
jgi:hypothetical protein